MRDVVVICLKKETYYRLDTTACGCALHRPRCDLLKKGNILQIRYNIQYIDKMVEYSCDLLKKGNILQIRYNVVLSSAEIKAVVICLKKETYYRLDTTLVAKPVAEKTCCDLLKKGNILQIRYNPDY